MRIKVSDAAIADLEDLRTYIACDNDLAAERVVARIQQTITMFADFPMLGHEGSVGGTREFKVRGLPYIVVYRIASPTDLVIQAIIHGRRNYPGDQTAG